MTIKKQFTDGDIPLQYHFNMLMDQERIEAFRAAIEVAVAPGATVLELGGGTGVLSFFAAQRAAKVWCVERNPTIIETTRRLLDSNPNGHKVELVHADAREFVPPEPVDVVICEMLHSALIFEQQVNVIDTFKRNYVAKHGPQLPSFIPEGTIMYVQPVQQSYSFAGFTAPVPMFQYRSVPSPRTVELANPAIYSGFCYDEPFHHQFRVDDDFRIVQSGHFNAVRFFTRNILAITDDKRQTIDWWNQNLVLPTSDSYQVHIDDVVHIACPYTAGIGIESLQSLMQISVSPAVAMTESTIQVAPMTSGSR